MAVELAVLIPVAIVVGLAVHNLARFACLCAEFDRVAANAVLCQGVSPSGAPSAVASVSQVQSAIEATLGADGRTFDVRAERLGLAGMRGSLSLSPLLTRFTCTMRVRPWPSSLVIAGVSLDAPVALVHRRTLVVDRYRPGVVM